MKFELELTDEEKEIIEQNELARQREAEEEEDEWDGEESWEEIVKREVRIIEQSDLIWERFNKI